MRWQKRGRVIRAVHQSERQHNVEQGEGTYVEPDCLPDIDVGGEPSVGHSDMEGVVLDIGRCVVWDIVRGVGRDGEK